MGRRDSNAGRSRTDVPVQAGIGWWNSGRILGVHIYYFDLIRKVDPGAETKSGNCGSLKRLAATVQSRKTWRMCQSVSAQIFLESAEDTAGLAALIAPLLTASDTLLLAGEVGSGKTHFARAIIQSRLGAVSAVEDVPSPTYTLVQTYNDGICDIWHADLYRLSGQDEVIELGLADAFQDAICLIEWPDRLGNLNPGNPLNIEFFHTEAEGSRTATITGDVDKWSKLNSALEVYVV